MMASVSDVKFSKQELESYTKSSNSCVKLERKTRVIFLLPSHFADLNAGVRETLDSLLLKYDYLFKAIIIGYGKIKIQSKYGSICYGRSKIALRIEADFYLFHPEVGSHLEGIVCKQSAHHLGCLVYKAFNVSIPLDEDGYISGWDFTIGQAVKFIVVQLDLTSGPLPYIKGQVDNDEIKGKPCDSSGSQFGADSGFDNGTEDDSETEETPQEARPTTLREETGASSSKKEKKEIKSKTKKLDKKDVLHSIQSDGESFGPASSPRREKIDIDKPSGRKLDSSLEKGEEMSVNESPGTMKGCIQMSSDDAKDEGKSEPEAHNSGVKTKSRSSKNKSRESTGKRDSLISQLMKTMEMSFEGENGDQGTAETPPQKRSKKRESVGSSVKKNNKRNLQGTSVADIDSLATVCSEKSDKMATSSDKPSILRSSVNESVIKTCGVNGVHGKTDEIQSPSKKVSHRKVLTKDNVLSPPKFSDADSSNAMNSNAAKEKTCDHSSSGGDDVVVPSGSLTKENENLIDKLLGMNEKLLGVSPSSKKKSTSRKSTICVKPPSHLPKVDENRELSEEPLPSGADAMQVSNVLGKVSEEGERMTPLKKKGARKSLTNDNNDLLSPAKGKRKSVGNKRSNETKVLLGDVLSESKVEDVNVSPKNISGCEDIIGKLLNMKKELLVDNVGGGHSTDSNEAKRLGKRKRKSVESDSGPQPKLKRSEHLEKHPFSDVVQSNVS